MTFATIGAGGVLAGLAGLAALLFALQQLRTRYRDVTVVTTLFWKQVVDEAPVRTLWDRFRHPLAYLLVLAICASVWIAFAEPQFDAAPDQTFHVLVIDGSAGMAAGDRFPRAVEALEQQVARLPASRRQVIWSGAEVRPLLGPDEQSLLLTKRLEQMAPEAAPSTLERTLRQIGAASRGEEATSVLVFGDAPVSQQVLNLMPASVTVTRATTPATLTGNSGVTALGVADAASGDWDKVDVFVDVQSTADRRSAGAQGVSMDVDGQALPAGAARMLNETPADGGRSGFIVEDVPATGGRFTVRLASDDGLALDNSASIRLPKKSIVTVQVSASLARQLDAVFAADAGVTLVDAAPDVVVRLPGEAVGGAVPALEFVPAASQAQAFVLTHPAALDSSAVLARAVDDIGLKEIDAMALARESGRPIEVSIAPGQQWRFSVWHELLSDDFNFTRSRAFPLFIANAVRWLAGTEAWRPYAAAGRPLAAASPGEWMPVVTDAGRVIDPVGPAFVPPVAGALPRSGEAAPLLVSLLDRAVTTGVRDEALRVDASTPVGRAAVSTIATWLIVAALLLLAVEWYLSQMGRMP